MEHSSDDAFPFAAATTNEPGISPAESEERRAAAAAKKSHKDVEKRLDSLERLLNRLHDIHSRDLEKKRRRRAKYTQVTAGAIRRAQQVSQMEAVTRLGQRNRAVDGVDIYTRSPSPLQDIGFNPVEAFQDFTQFARYLPPELHQGPLIAPFVYSIQHMFMPPVVHRSLATVYSDHDVRNRHYQELMHAYLHLTADRLADMSPCYIDFWRSYIPAMAFGQNGSLALLNAMVALAALHIAPLQADNARGKQRAWEFYHLALQHQGQATGSSPDDWVLATSLILAHYELWDGEITKMGTHMLGAKNIIGFRGKAACQTPIGRALFAFFIRSDMTSSVVTGNPVFLDESWWKNDPLYHVQIPPEAPILLAADAAMTTLSVIIAKLTLLKRSAAKRREDKLEKLRNRPDTARSNPGASLARTEEHIRRDVNDLQRELDNWHRNLPAWFGSLQGGQTLYGEEDVNQPTIIEITAQRYPHYSVPVVLGCAFAAHLQLWRVAYPDEFDPPPRIGGFVNAVFRAYLATPSTADSMTISNVWIAALLLRHKYHRDWLQGQIQRRIRETDFYGWKFAYHGILHGWAVADGEEAGRFKSVPSGAQEIVPGVSENLWRADGIMNTRLSDLAGEDENPASPEGQPIYRFMGDTQIYPTKDSDDEEEEQLNAGGELWEQPVTSDVGGQTPGNSSFIDDY